METKEKANNDNKKRDFIWNIIGTVITGMIIVILFIFFTHDENTVVKALKDNLLLLILSFYIFLMYIVNFLKSKTVDQLLCNVQKKSKINSLMTSIVLVSLVTIAMTAQTNEIAKRQVEIEDRETAPALSVEPHQNNTYIITNSKGMASYVMFNVYERYNFTYQGEAYEVSLATYYQEQDNQYTLGDEKETLVFEPETTVIDKDKAFDIFQNYLHEKTEEDIVVSNSKELELSFYDYRNQNFCFQYSDYNGEIHLINTNRNSVPLHNITLSVYESNQLDRDIKYAIDYLL